MPSFPLPPTACLYRPQDSCWLVFQRPRAVLSAHRIEDVSVRLREVEQAVAAHGYWAVGMVSYEAAPGFDAALRVHEAEGFPLLWFALFDRVERISQQDQQDQQDQQEMHAATNPFLEASPEWQANVSAIDYAHAVQTIRQHIAAGDTYQVNYSFRLQRPWTQDPWHFFLQTLQGQPPPYSAYLDMGDWAVCSLSPELFFSKRGTTLLSKPMKGTQPRGLSFADDQARAAWLQQSEKNRAENVMIVDMVRNDMGRIATPGSVTVPRLFDIEQYATVWQMTSTVHAQSDATITDIFTALFPPASITGAPKCQAMKIIRDVETTARHAYTGSVGFISPDQQAQFNVAIRTVVIDKARHAAEYGIGSGIVWDSTSADEYQECLDKAAILRMTEVPFSLLESLLWTPDAGIFLASYHWQRLQQSAQYFSWSLDWTMIQQQLHDYLHTLPTQAHKVRLQITRAGGLEIEATPLQPFPTPYRLGLAKAPITSQHRWLYHKTTHRQVYDAALAAARPAYDDVLLWNEAGEITESCIANVLFEMEGQWFTPPVASGLLPGTYRAWLLAQGWVQERKLHKNMLVSGIRLRLMNAVRKQWDVTLG